MTALNIWAVALKPADAQHKSASVAIYRVRQMISVEDALNLAAWIVAIADPGCEQFALLLQEIKKS